jgi:hypothetical protein
LEILRLGDNPHAAFRAVRALDGAANFIGRHTRITERGTLPRQATRERNQRRYDAIQRR